MRIRLRPGAHIYFLPKNNSGTGITIAKGEKKRKVVPTKGLEPSPAYTDCDLNAARLPFRHVGTFNDA